MKKEDRELRLEVPASELLDEVKRRAQVDPDTQAIIDQMIAIKEEEDE